MMKPRQVLRGAAYAWFCSSPVAAFAGLALPCLPYVQDKTAVTAHEFSEGETLSGVLNRIRVDERKLCLYGPDGWVTHNVQSNTEIPDWTKIQISQRIMITVPASNHGVPDVAPPAELPTFEAELPVVSSDSSVSRQTSIDPKFAAGLRYGRSLSQDRLLSRATWTSLSLSTQVGDLPQIGFRWDEVPKIAVSNDRQVDISFGLRRLALNASVVLSEPNKDLRFQIVPILSNYTIDTVEPLTGQRERETSTEVKLSGIWAMGYELDGQWQFLPRFKSRFWFGQDFGSARFASRTVRSNRFGADVSWLAHSIHAVDLRILSFIQYEDLTVHARDQLQTTIGPQDLTVSTALPVLGVGATLDF